MSNFVLVRKDYLINLDLIREIVFYSSFLPTGVQQYTAVCTFENGDQKVFEWSDAERLKKIFAEIMLKERGGAP